MHTAAAAADVNVAEGSTDAFDLAEVLQLASMSRVFTVVEIHSLAAQWVGSIYLKGGQVLDSVTALAGGDVGLVALSHLIRYGDTVNYRIFRASNPDPMPRPLGRLEALLLEVKMADEAIPETAPLAQAVRGPWPEPPPVAGWPTQAPLNHQHHPTPPAPSPLRHAAVPPAAVPPPAPPASAPPSLTPLVTAMAASLHAIDKHLAHLTVPPPRRGWRRTAIAAATAAAFLLGGAVGATAVLFWV